MAFYLKNVVPDPQKNADLDADLAQKQSIFTKNGPFLCRIRIFLRIRIHIFKTEYCNFDQFLDELDPDPDPYIWIQLDPDPDPQKKIRIRNPAKDPRSPPPQRPSILPAKPYLLFAHDFITPDKTTTLHSLTSIRRFPPDHR